MLILWQQDEVLILLIFRSRYMYKIEHCNKLLIRALVVLKSITGTFHLKLFCCFASLTDFYAICCFANLTEILCHFAVLLAWPKLNAVLLT